MQFVKNPNNHKRQQQFSHLIIFFDFNQDPV